jgi:bla regulator protein blaR1
MRLYLLQDLIAEPLIKAIGWTLFHSIWQGILLAMIAGAGIIFTRYSKPSIRYNLLSTLLILFIAGVVVTFLWQLDQRVAINTPDFGIAMGTIDSETYQIQNNTHSSYSFTLSAALKDFVDRNAVFLVTTWFLIFLVKSASLAINIGKVQRIRRDWTRDVPEWHSRLTELARDMKIHGKVLLRESSLIKVPVVIGFLKPIILLPIGLLANLPITQVEAILLHELAHIRRKDYLINLAQCFCETIFFFNPAVLWISTQIRQERENCCDDMAIAISGNKTEFIHALVAFHEYDRKLLVPAFPGQKYPVLQRVKRIVYNNNKNLNNMEKIFIASGFFVAATIGLAFSFDSNTTVAEGSRAASFNMQVPLPGIGKPGVRKVEGTRMVFMDTIPKRSTEKRRDLTGTITTHHDGKEYTIILKDNVIKGLFIDSDQVPDDQIAKYKDITDKLINETIKFSEAAKADAEIMKERSEHYREIAIAEKMRHERAKQESAEYLQEKKRKLQETHEMIDKEKKLMMVYQKRLAEAENDMNKKEMVEYEEKENDMEMIRLKANLLNEAHAKSMKEKTELARKMAARNKEMAREMAKHASEDRKKANNLQTGIINQLFEDKIIQDRKTVSFEINDDEMFVNGVKQPESVHKKYRNKFIKSKNSRINFNYSDSNKDEE